MAKPGMRPRRPAGLYHCRADRASATVAAQLPVFDAADATASRRTSPRSRVIIKCSPVQRRRRSLHRTPANIATVNAQGLSARPGPVGQPWDGGEERRAGAFGG